MKQDIHAEAVRVLGKRERLEHLRKECIELAHEIDRYLDGKSDAGRVVAETHDVEYIAKSLRHIDGFGDFCDPVHQYYLDEVSRTKLSAALKRKRIIEAAVSDYPEQGERIVV